MSDRDDKLLLELADESRREFLKKLGKGVAGGAAMATGGIPRNLPQTAKKVLRFNIKGNYGDPDHYDAYDALSFALDNMFEFGRAESDLSMPLDLQQKLGDKLQDLIIGARYAYGPGQPSSLKPASHNFYADLIDNADEYSDMDEAIASTSATLQDVFDYKKIFKGADKIWKEKGRAGIEDIEEYIKKNVYGYIDADYKGDTGYEGEPEPVDEDPRDYEGEPEPVDEDPRDYLERDYASGPHMNSFKPEMSFKQFYLTEHKRKKKKKEKDEEVPETVFSGPGEAEAANKGREMRKDIPEQPNVAGAPDIINSPGPNYTNQPSLGVTKYRTKKNKNIVRGLYKTDV